MVFITGLYVVPGGAGVACHGTPRLGHLTLSQPGGADYTLHITKGTPGSSDLPTALYPASYATDDLRTGHHQVLADTYAVFPQ